MLEQRAICPYKQIAHCVRYFLEFIRSLAFSLLCKLCEKRNIFNVRFIYCILRPRCVKKKKLTHLNTDLNVTELITGYRFLSVSLVWRVIWNRTVQNAVTAIVDGIHECLWSFVGIELQPTCTCNYVYRFLCLVTPLVMDVSGTSFHCDDRQISSSRLGVFVMGNSLGWRNGGRGLECLTLEERLSRNVGN